MAAAVRSPGQRAGLTREAILDAARLVLAEDGLDKLSMRAVARHLEVAPNALYSHVSGKTGLVDLLLDDILAEIEPSLANVRQPIDALGALMTDTFDVLLNHADLLPTYLARQGARGQHAHRLGAEVDDLLAAAKVRGAKADEAQHVLIIYTIGFAAFAAHPNIDADGKRGRPAAAMRQDFATGLTWLLTGITRRKSN